MAILLVFVSFPASVFAQESFLGAWRESCDPLPTNQDSQICSYTFNDGGKGSYSCEKFSDLRCTKPAGKTTVKTFTFETISTRAQNHKVKLDFSDGDISQETILLSVKGDVILITGLESKSRNGAGTVKGVTIPFKYVRVR